MPDITMCKGENCKIKHLCVRHTSTPNDLYQSYFMESPIKNGECYKYIPNQIALYNLKLDPSESDREDGEF